MHYRPDEIEYLQKNFNGFNTEEMAAALGRTVSSVKNKVQRLGLASRRRERPFSTADDHYILEHYAKGNAAELSRALHHSAREINGRAARRLRTRAPDTRAGMRRVHHKYGKAAGVKSPTVTISAPTSPNGYWRDGTPFMTTHATRPKRAKPTACR